MVNNEHRIRKYCSFKGIVYYYILLRLDTQYSCAVVLLHPWKVHHHSITPILQLGRPTKFLPAYLLGTPWQATASGGGSWLDSNFVLITFLPTRSSFCNPIGKIGNFETILHLQLQNKLFILPYLIFHSMRDGANKITKAICWFGTPFGRYAHSFSYTSSSIVIYNLFI